MTVSSPIIGKNKRNFVQDPVKSPNDWKLEFLLEFGNFVTIWEESMVSLILLRELKQIGPVFYLVLIFAINPNNISTKSFLIVAELHKIV